MEIGSINSYSPSIQPVDPKATEKPVMNAPKETEADAKKMFQLAVQTEQTKGNKVDLKA
jgi:hypothetical protein